VARSGHSPRRDHKADACVTSVETAYLPGQALRRVLYTSARPDSTHGGASVYTSSTRSYIHCEPGDRARAGLCVKFRDSGWRLAEGRGGRPYERCVLVRIVYSAPHDREAADPLGRAGDGAGVVERRDVALLLRSADGRGPHPL